MLNEEKVIKYKELIAKLDKINNISLSTVREIMDVVRDLEKDIAKTDPDNLEAKDAYLYRLAYMTVTSVNKRYQTLAESYRDIISIYEDIVKYYTTKKEDKK